MSLYCGIDLHSNNQVIVVIDDNDKRLLERRVPYEIGDYLELVDGSGRAVIEGKRGYIPEYLPPILDRLKVCPWLSGFVLGFILSLAVRVCPRGCPVRDCPHAPGRSAQGYSEVP